MFREGLAPKSALSVLSQVFGGLYALKETEDVLTAIEVMVRHDENRCITCGSDEHAAADCAKKGKGVSNLPAGRQVQAARAETVQAKQETAEAKRAREAADEIRKGAENALAAAPAVAQLATAAPAPRGTQPSAPEGRECRREVGRTRRAQRSLVLTFLLSSNGKSPFLTTVSTGYALSMH